MTTGTRAGTIHAMTTSAHDAAFGGQQAEDAQLTPLTPEERNDLRQRVLRGERLSVEEARRIYLTLRSSQGAVQINGEAKPKRQSKKKQAMDDASLDASLSEFGL